MSKIVLNSGEGLLMIGCEIELCCSGAGGMGIKELNNQGQLVGRGMEYKITDSDNKTRQAGRIFGCRFRLGQNCQMPKCEGVCYRVVSELVSYAELAEMVDSR